MRFLLTLLLVFSVFVAAFAAFVLPRQHLETMLSQLPAKARAALEPEYWAEPFQRLTHQATSNSVAVKVTSESDLAIGRATGTAIGNWVYRCNRRDEPGDACTITHQFAEDGRVRFSWQILIDLSGQIKSRWQTETGIQVDRGIELRTSGKKPLTLPYSKCMTGYCESAAELNQAFIQTVLGAEQTTATVHDSNGKPVTYPISVNGLAASLRMLGQS
ncbi:MAG: invasion associated locus B family protein [Pseudomonadota bacterium]